jgi:transposase InsO family protein
MEQITEVNQKQGIPVDRLCDALAIPRATYYRRQGTCAAKPSPPGNAMTVDEKQTVLGIMHSEKFVDKTPYHIFNTLIDEGVYHCSVRSMYRMLEKQGESSDRRPQRNHRDAVKPELIAVRSNEVWSWDITKLLSLQKWVYFHLYVILDIYSRCVVGWLIAEEESRHLARRLIQQTALKHGIQPGRLTLHSDNGPSMKSQTVSQLLDHMGIIKTHNRPYTSNDNPFSESQFKTLKYCPEFPGRFASIKEAEIFCRQFFEWYNREHYHSGIAWLTPVSVHQGHAEKILEQRHSALMVAYENNPARFKNKPPQLQKLPPAVYINPPQTVSILSLQERVIMA